MEVGGWEERYRSRERTSEDFDAAPSPLLVEVASKFAPGRALDLACGTGRNALWLGEHGWQVTAVDGSAAAIEEVRRRARDRDLEIEARVADLEKSEYRIAPDSWDLIAILYYLPTDSFEAAKRGVVPGGIVLAIVHAAGPGEEPTSHRLRSGTLRDYFRGWEILHSREGAPTDATHKRLVAEIAARRPTGVAAEQ